MTLPRTSIENSASAPRTSFRRNLLLALVGLAAIVAGAGRAQAQASMFSPVGTTEAPGGFAQFCVTGTPTYGSGIVAGFYTETQINQDYTNYIVNSQQAGNAGGSCGSGGQNWSAGYTFTPKQLGTRLGHGIFYDCCGNVLAVGYFANVGTGGLPAYAAANGGNAPALTVYLTGTPHPDSMVFDSVGTFYYVSNVASGTLTSRTTGGTVTTWPTFYGPIAVTVDGGGYEFLLSSSPGGGNSSGNFQQFHGNNTGVAGSIAFTPTGVIQGGSIGVDGQGNLYVPGPVGVAVFTRSNSYAKTTIASSLTIASVTMDTSFNLWCLTTDNKVVEMDTSGNILTQFATGMSSVTGILLDPAGDIYVSSFGSQEVIRYAVGTFTPTVVASGFQATGLTMDAQGNLYIGDDTNGRILKLNLATAALAFPSTQIPASSGPQSLTLFNAGNTNLSLSSLSFASAGMFSLDSFSTCNTSTNLAPGASCVIAADFTPTASGAISQTATVSHSASNVTGSPTFPIALTGLAVPGSKTVSFTALPTTATAGSTATLSATASNGDPVTFLVTSGVARISGNTVTYTNDGSVTITAYSAATSTYAAATSSQTVTVTGDASGTTLTGQTATVTITTAGTLGQINVLTKGASLLDFQLAGGGTCAAGTAYTVSQTCTVAYTFAATRPGQRLGAVSLSTSGNAAGVTLGTTLLSGTGTGPLVTFPDSEIASVIGSSFNHPAGVAVDGSGDIFVADGGSAAVKEIVATNGVVNSSSTVKTVGSGFTVPAGIAVDGSGNVFVSDSTANVVKEIFAVNGQVSATSTMATVGSGFLSPAAVAVDAAGNVFVADNKNNAAKEIVAVNGVVSSSSTVNTIGSGFSKPLGIAVDASGNVFVGDSGNNAVKEIVAVSGAVSSGSTVNTVGSGFSLPAGVAVGAGENVFVADQNNNAIKEIVASNGLVSTSSVVNTLVNGGYSVPLGVALDDTGKVFVANTGNSNVQQVALTTVPSLTFAQTAVGQTSSDSSKTFHVVNEGNAPLVFAVPGSGVNPNVPTGFALQAASTCPQASAGGSAVSLVASGSCAEVLSFTPSAAGSYTTPLTLTDNNLGVSGSVQSVGLSATAVQTTQSINFSGLASPAANGTSATLSATATSGLTVTFRLVRGPATLSGSTLSYTGAGIVVVEADQTGNAVYSAATPVQQTVHVLAVSPGTSLSGVSIGTITITTAGTLGQINVLTQGAPNRDFKFFSGGSCTIGTAYLVGAQCDVAYTFSQTGIGVRAGGVSLTTGSSNSAANLGSLPISAGGEGPLAIFPGTMSAHNLTTNSATEITEYMVVDGAGNAYIARGSRIYKLAAVNGVINGNSTVTIVNSVPFGFGGMAIDGLGNLFVSDGYQSVYEIAAVNGGPPSQPLGTTTGLAPVVSINSSFNIPVGLTLDASGNVYVADYQNNAVKEIMAGTGGNPAGVVSSASTVNTLTSGRSQPVDVAVDPYGQVFFAQQNGVIAQIINSSNIQTITTSPSGFATSLAVDANDDLYFTDSQYVYQFDTLTFVYGDNSYYGSTHVIANANSAATSVRIDANGHLFVADVYPTEIDLTVPPALTFPATAVGSTSAAQTFVMLNAGYIVSNFDAATLNYSESLTPGFVFDSGRTCHALTNATVQEGCVVAIDFAPAIVGTTTGTLAITDNSNGVSGSVQTSSLTGTTTQAAPVITVTSSAITYGTATTTLTATVTTTSTLPTGAQTFQVDGGTAYTPSCVVNGSTETCTYPYPTAALGLGTHTITFFIAADSTFAADSGSAQLVISSSAAVGSTTSSMMATLTFSTAATLNSTLATAIQVGAQGNVGVEYNYVSGGTCTPGASYTAGQSCTVGFTFTPEAPGPRPGGVNLHDNSAPALLVASTSFSATGTGPQALLQTGKLSAILSSSFTFYTARGLSVDAASNVYVSDQRLGEVERYSSASSTVSTVMTMPVSVSSGNTIAPGGTAVDGAGDLFVAGAPGLYKVPVGSSSYVTLNSTVNADNNLSIDAGGNLYTSDNATGAIYELSPPTYAATTLVAGGLGYRFIGMARDGNGNLFAADYNNSVLYEVVAGSHTLTQLYSGAPLANPHAVTVDAAGNVYVANINGSSSFRFAAGSYSATPTTLPMAAQRALAIGPDGALYAVPSDTTVVKYSRTASALAAFASTTVGATSAVQTVTLENDGNMALTYSGAAATTSNFAIVPASTTCNSTLASASTCVVGVDFTPKAGGPLSDTLLLMDDSLYGNAMQNVSLTGTGTPGAQTITFPQPQSPVAYSSGVTVALSATASSGLPVTFSYVSGPGTVSGSTLTLTGTGTVVVEADQAGNASYAAATAVQRSVVSTSKQVPPITWAPAANKSYTGLALGSGVLNATSTVSGTISYTATLQPSGTPVSVTPATELAAGSYVLTVTLAPTDTTTYIANSATAMFLVQAQYVWLVNGNGTVSQLDAGGNAISGTGGYTSAGSAAKGIAIDASGSVWTLSTSSVLEYGVSGTVLSGGGYTGGGISSPSALAVDGTGQVFVPNGNGSISVLSNNGTAVSPVTGDTGGNMSAPSSLAVDNSGRVWVANGNNSVTEVIGAGAAPVTTPTVSGVTNNTVGVRP